MPAVLRIQMMKKAGTKNPVFMLDEVDKMSSDFRGDPSSMRCWKCSIRNRTSCSSTTTSMSNTTSRRYFSLPPPTSCTPFHPALQDRMEVLRLHGYTEPEKLEIAKHYLVKKQREAGGIEASRTLHLPTTPLPAIIRSYTREAGVRNLEREIGNVCRKVARKVVKEGQAGTPSAVNG